MDSFVKKVPKITLVITMLITTALATMAVGSAEAADTDAPEAPETMKPEGRGSFQDEIRQDQAFNKKYKHILGHHVFLPSAVIPAPFADSNANLSSAFGYGTFESPTLLGNGTRTLTIGSSAPNVRGQVSFLDHFAVNFGFRANFSAGLNTASALNYGGSALYSIYLGGIWEFIRTESTVLSANLQLERPHTYSLSPLLAATQAIQNFAGTLDPDFVSNSVTTRWKPAVEVAHAFNPMVGIKGLLGFRFDAVNENSDIFIERSKMSIGVSGDFNFDPWVKVPIGISLTYLRSQILSGGENGNIFSGGIFETFNPSFNAGFEAGSVNLGSLSSFVGLFSARTYFN
jgi:hypothetical protein